MKITNQHVLLKPQWIVIHHSATPKDCTVEDIRRFHLERGWDDIGYHWLIDWQGNVYQGRAENVIGAHARGINDRSLGICCIGNFEDETPTAETLAALRALVNEIITRFGINKRRIIGHRDVKKLFPGATDTVCPGENLYCLLDALRGSLA